MTTAVAVALYNGERFIEKQMDCLRLQTQIPNQVVFCDDGSKDRTVQMVNDYIINHQLQDSWKVYINEQNLGYARNFYKAISLCDADLIFLCDQDDLWETDKIQKMTAVMESKSDIALLSCKYGIIDENDQRMHSLIERDSKQTEQVREITTVDLMRAYRWPGMVMCLRNDFFESILPSIQNSAIAHDMMFALFAADRSGFYEYDYVGAYHRRHGNNTAREEHRIWKILKFEKKLFEIGVYNRMLTGLIDLKLPVKTETTKLLMYRLEKSQTREKALREKRLRELVQIYSNDPLHMMRFSSFVCDLWLILFGTGKQ